MRIKFRKITIIGMGLIGGSIGKALIKKGLAEEVVGVCRRKISLEKALRERSLTKGFVNSYTSAVDGADLVIIATPVHTVISVLEKLGGVLSGGKTLVTDVGSTKKEIIKASEKYRDRFCFMGGHPLAGSEKAGVENSSAGLFDGSVCVLTPPAGKLGKRGKTLERLWRDIGVSTICVMTPEEHDKALAFSSHLPHVSAYALAGTLEEGIAREVFSTGFRDTARIASSDAALWSDIFMSNRMNVLGAIKKYKSVISSIEKDIREKNTKGLTKKLAKFKRLKDELN
jgi:prephenate dehydrogenase